jgi:hypothetical protein
MNGMMRSKSRFFKTHEDGRMLFYPWAYPGESFFIDDKHKKEITKFLIIIFFLSLLIMIGVDISAHYRFIDSFGSALIFMAAWVIFPLWYIYHMRVFTKKMEPFIPELKVMPAIFYILLFFLSIKILTIVMGFYAYQALPIVSTLIFIEGVYAVILICFLGLSIKNRGYFSTK